MKYIFHCFSLLLLLAAASACGAVRPLANTADSTRVEVRTERVFIHDTAYVELPVQVEKEIVYRDSIVFRDRVIMEEIEVEKPLTFWQQFKMRAGVAAMILTGLYALYLLLRLYLKKKAI